MEVLDAALQDSADEMVVDILKALERLGNGAGIKRLGYLMEALGYETSAIARPLTTGFPLLDPALGANGSRSSEWGLIVNADISA
ncbi:hypothetical protein [Candidatus Poriferisocius sp.]|uniref:hypothetical protein n=1 Tax=Candidatus Poriferisocius sp. TaxID=3101276 RepID=UPI003B02489A